MANEAAYIREEPEKKLAFTIWKSERLDSVKRVIDFAKTVPVEPAYSAESLINWSVRERVLAPITTKPTMQCQRKDFLKCIGTCKKEARESKHFPCAWLLELFPN